jgi:polygalacturonase
MKFKKVPGGCVRHLMTAAAFLSFITAMPAAPNLPNINTNNIITVTNAPYNAVGNGSTDNTLAISNAIVAAAAGGNVGGLFGGTVRIPAPGTFLTGPLTFKNNVNFQIDAGATLKMQPLSVWTNLPAQNQTYGNLIYAAGATNLEISGSGTIDGNGAGWWNSTGSVFANRPYMIFFNGNCGRVLIQNVTIQNPPKMHIVFKGFDNNLTIQGMTINTTAVNADNTDGIDLVGTNCLIQNCTINAGDDNIALGSSSSSAISKDVLITNCTFGRRSRHFHRQQHGRRGFKPDGDQLHFQWHGLRHPHEVRRQHKRRQRRRRRGAKSFLLQHRHDEHR